MSEKKIIVTIGREFGSGGHEIGEKLAAKLGVNFYDKNLIELAAEHSGLDLSVLGATDEKAPSPFVSPYAPTISDQLYRAQSEVIQKLAQKESFVIVGRCSNTVLDECASPMNVFIYAPLDIRIKRIMDRYLIDSPEKARKEILRTDKIRRGYYQYYSEYRWGDREGYDVMIDSSVFGIDGTVDILFDIVQHKFK
ncbi:MAG: AAA family ATPase [Coprococcus sp.]